MSRIASLHVTGRENPSGSSPLKAPTQTRASRFHSDNVLDRDALVQQAVDAAMHAGAQYADARITRTEEQSYCWLFEDAPGQTEHVGIGVRALVNGAWGFSACPSADLDQVGQLALDAVAQARVNGRGAVTPAVELGQLPTAKGSWSTPLRIDPFTVPFEEKLAFMQYWELCAQRAGLAINPGNSEIHFRRQVRVVSNSEGSHFTQTLMESGGQILLKPGDLRASTQIVGIETAGVGWEQFLDADIPRQMQTKYDESRTRYEIEARRSPAQIGRYTLVCDGATMAALLEVTIGVATQLDRALGYESNAAGTSYLDDPLTMLGTFRMTAPGVTVTANRSAPTQLATVRWDDEGVEPETFTLVRDGVLTDFQTTREQAAWLAPYYATQGRPVRSHGCAGAEHALYIAMQHMPNLSLEPATAATQIDELIADVKDGLFIERGVVTEMDSQLRNGVLYGSIRRIRNGKLGAYLDGGIIPFDTRELWKNVVALGGVATRVVVPHSMWRFGFRYEMPGGVRAIESSPYKEWSEKGEPRQMTSHSIQAVAATIMNQPLILDQQSD